MRILVTGSSGFIGSILVKKLISLGDEVVGCDLVPSNFHHYPIDFTNSNLLAGIFQKYTFDSCFHLGAIADVNYAREHLDETVKVNVFGTANIIHFCNEHNVPLNYMSTCCVYGNTSNHPTTEDAPKYPTEIYGYTKLAAEQILQGYHSLTGLNYNIIRPSTVYGSGMRHALAICIFLDRAKKNKPLLIHGTGKQTRTFIHISDLINGIIPLRKRFFNTPINFAGRETIDILTIAKECISATKSQSKLVFVDDRPGQIMHEEIDTSKAEKLLGWKPKRRVNDFIHCWWRKNGS